MLLLCAGREIGDQIIRLRARAEDLARVGVHGERLGGLRAAVYADEELSHGNCLTVARATVTPKRMEDSIQSTEMWNAQPLFRSSGIGCKAWASTQKLSKAYLDSRPTEAYASVHARKHSGS